METFVVASILGDTVRLVSTGVVMALIVVFWYQVMSRIGTF